MNYLLAAVVAFGIVYIAVPVLRAIALQTGFVDRPSSRKIHTVPIPLLGGGAIYIGIVASFFLFQGITNLSITVAVGGLLLVTIGLIDDRAKTKGKEFPVWPRVVVYAAASFIPAATGIRISGVTDPGPELMFIFPEWVSVSATVVWVFALINMINFIDGVDGLASGVATLSSSTLFITALVKGQLEIALLAVILVGSCIAFLVYNFYPARIFMGDAGATFLGYTLAVIAVEGAFKSATLVTMAVPLLALGLPIMDTVIVMTRRLISGRGLHRADKLHAHHLLMRWGLNQVQTVSFLYLIAALFSLLSIVILFVVRN